MTTDFPDLNSVNFPDLMPKDVELMMRYLVRELSSTQEEYSKVRHEYAKAKASYTVEMAIARDEAKSSGNKTTAQEREDIALLQNRTLFEDLLTQEAKVDVYKGKIERLKAQSDLVRSVNASVRESMRIGE